MKGAVPLKRAFTRQEMTLVLLVFSVYLLAILLEGSWAGFPLFANMGNYMYAQFLLIPSFLLFLRRRSVLVNHIWCRVRVGDERRAFWVRIWYLLTETALFTAPLLIITIALSLRAGFSLTSALLCYANVLFGFSQIGVIYCVLAVKTKNDIPCLVLFVVLLFDYFCANGYFFALMDFSQFFVPTFSIFGAAPPENLPVRVLTMLGKAAALFGCSVLLFQGVRLRGPRRASVQSEMRLLRRCFLAVPLGLLFSVTVNLYGTENLEHLLISTLGGLVFKNTPPLLMAAQFTIAQLLPFFLFGSLFSSELDRAAVYLFPRSFSRSWWMLSKSVTVLCAALLFYILMVASILGSAALLGIPALSFSTLCATCFALIGTAGLCQAAFILLSNVMSLKMHSSISLLLTWFFFTPAQMLAGLLPKQAEMAVMLYPASQAVLLLHDIPTLGPLFSEQLQYALSGFTQQFSVFYNIMLLSCVTILGLSFIRRHDFVGTP